MLKYDVLDHNLGNNNNVTLSRFGSEVTFGYPCSSNVECTPYVVTLKRGTYVFEVWGAEGGLSTYRGSMTQRGGKGGYSIGAFTATSQMKIYVFVGGKGTDSGSGFYVRKGGFNGGGNGGTDGSAAYGSSGGGGGATDIRLVKDDLNSRLIVAGAGGSGSDNGVLAGYAAYGGGSKGSDGLDFTSNSIINGYGGKGGTQDSGGEANTIRGATSGIFGFGGNGSTGYQANGGGAGGGGWYGGGGGTSTQNHPYGYAGAGGGGSGFVGRVKSLNGYDLIKETIAGNEEFNAPYGGKETGHLGHGVCKISYLFDSCSFSIKRSYFSASLNKNCII